MKRLISVMLVIVLALCMLAGCAKHEAKDDIKAVKENGKLIVGITEFKPMDYKEDGKWVGFDADLATKFAKALGVEVEFKVINWDNKVLELNDLGIDCVWNGMTIKDELKKEMDISVAYLKNAQVVVVNEAVAANYQSVDSLKNLKFAVEGSSAGESVAKENEFDVNVVEDQATALMEVASGTSDACIIDLLMANATVGEGTDYPTLTYTVELNSEQYGVGFRKGSDLTEKFNQFYAQELEDGTIEALANKYNIPLDTIIK